MLKFSGSLHVHQGTDPWGRQIHSQSSLDPPERGSRAWSVFPWSPALLLLGFSNLVLLALAHGLSKTNQRRAGVTRTGGFQSAAMAHALPGMGSQNHRRSAHCARRYPGQGRSRTRRIPPHSTGRSRGTTPGLHGCVMHTRNADAQAAQGGIPGWPVAFRAVPHLRIARLCVSPNLSRGSCVLHQHLSQDIHHSRFMRERDYPPGRRRIVPGWVSTTFRAESHVGLDKQQSGSVNPLSEHPLAAFRPLPGPVEGSAGFAHAPPSTASKEDTARPFFRHSFGNLSRAHSS